VTRFLQHTENKILRIGRKRDPNMDLGRVSRLLMKELGPSGDIAAAQMAMAGTGGGLLRVLRIIAARLAQEYTTNEISARVAKFWSEMSVEERLETTEEYLAKYGHLLPQDVTAGGAPRLKAYFPKFLEKHPELLTRLRRSGSARQLAGPK